MEIGARRALQQVPLSQVVWVIVLTKENLLEYLKNEAGMERPTEVFGELEMLQLLDQFFDRAIFYASMGYEQEVEGSRPGSVIPIFKETASDVLGENTKRKLRTANEALRCVQKWNARIHSPRMRRTETLVDALISGRLSFRTSRSST